ncbi:MAG TPA: hypothetical protein DCZ91_12305 [Lachnospiraceae bacterium]|nr:hypothetical protein [Lachnospiraceae bacterium]
MRMDRTPVYRYPGDYAEEHGELKQYRASYKADRACKNAIEEAVDLYHTSNGFDAKSAVREVMKQFGCERVLYILAVTVRHKAHDGRISRSNKEWARTVMVFKNPDSYGRDLNAWIVVDRCHPELMDLFVTAARHEHLLSLPLTAAEIKTEALEILSQFRGAQEPNSPEGTHFMAQISPDFITRAKTKDMERLTALLPFPSLEVRAITGRKGVYALISGEEDRFSKLQK